MTNRWIAETGGVAGPEYAARFDELTAQGVDVHGEARFVDGLLAPRSRVVDGGCGTGRVAAELSRRGHDVTGIDLDASMLEQAQVHHPTMRWVVGDLLEVDLGPRRTRVDAVVMAGNVLVYLTPGTEQRVVARVAGWLRPGGLLVAGFATDRHVSRADHRRWCAAVGLEPVTSASGWEGNADDDGPYTVQVHRSPGGPSGAGAGPDPA